jgi:hypothetical protein
MRTLLLKWRHVRSRLTFSLQPEIERLAGDFMPYDVRVIPISAFLRTDVSGTIERGTSRVILKELLKSCAERNINHVLIDCREAVGRATATDIFMLVNDFEELGLSRQHRIAILNRPKDDFDRAAFIALCAKNQGYQVQAFRDFEEAFTWLKSGDLASPQRAGL